MKNNRGFTLVELMVIIVILATLISMTVGVFYNSSEKSKERLLDSKKQKIEISAEKWANDVNLNQTITISIDRLIREGYLDSENEDGEILNPIDNSPLNCYTVFIDIRNGNYYAKVQEEINCDLMDEEKEDSKILLEAYEFNEDIQGAFINLNVKTLDWTNKNIKIYLSTDYENVVKIEWYRNNVPLNTLSDLEYEIEVNDDVFLNTKYKVVLTIENDDKTITKSSYIRVRIDKEIPVINSITIGDQNENNEYEVIIFHNDYDGSNVSSYYISTSDIISENEEDWILKENESEEIKVYLLPDTYNIWVKDKAGNISEIKQFKIE